MIDANLKTRVMTVKGKKYRVYFEKFVYGEGLNSPPVNIKKVEFVDQPDATAPELSRTCPTFRFIQKELDNLRRLPVRALGSSHSADSHVVV